MISSVSYGGGVQSTALLVLAAQQAIDYDLFIFANTGDDSEHPSTLEYVREIAIPYGEKHGIEVVEVSHDGPTLWQAATGQGSTGTFPLPFRGENGPPMTRACTATWKIRAIEKELKQRGASPEDPADVALGISVDEIHRAKSPGSIDPRSKLQRRHYPLLDLKLNRGDCQQIIRDSDLPVPAPSACFFCPFHNAESWRRLARETPDLFEKSIELERVYKQRLSDKGLRTQWMTDIGAARKLTLDRAVDTNQLELFVLDDDCTGSCFT